MNRLQNLNDWEARFVAYLMAHVDQRDGSHDVGHFQRVWRTARYINTLEGGRADELVLLAGAYFHDLVSLPKDHPERRESSRLSAERTATLLATEFPDFPPGKIPAVAHVIHAHSFSAGVAAETAEAKILQDADRMEALGAIGVARVFYIAGQLSSRMFDAEDPLAERRALDDRRFALDHFEVKLLKLPALMNTATGRALADRNADWMRAFVTKMVAEISGDFGILG
jgi:uncharacterized protein